MGRGLLSRSIDQLEVLMLMKEDEFSGKILETIMMRLQKRIQTSKAVAPGGEGPEQEGRFVN